MFAKQQASCDLNKTRVAYNAQLPKGKDMGLDEAGQAEPVRRSENDTHPIVESNTVDATVNAAVTLDKTKCGPEPVCQSL
jgi:hypothetical protein